MQKLQRPRVRWASEKRSDQQQHDDIASAAIPGQGERQQSSDPRTDSVGKQVWSRRCNLPAGFSLRTTRVMSHTDDETKRNAITTAAAFNPHEWCNRYEFRMQLTCAKKTFPLIKSWWWAIGWEKGVRIEGCDVIDVDSRNVMMLCSRFYISKHYIEMLQT